VSGDYEYPRVPVFLLFRCRPARSRVYTRACTDRPIDTVPSECPEVFSNAQNTAVRRLWSPVMLFYTRRKHAFTTDTTINSHDGVFVIIILYYTLIRRLRFAYDELTKRIYTTGVNNITRRIINSKRLDSTDELWNEQLNTRAIRV